MSRAIPNTRIIVDVIINDEVAEDEEMKSRGYPKRYRNYAKRRVIACSTPTDEIHALFSNTLRLHTIVLLSIYAISPVSVNDCEDTLPQ